MQKQKKCTQIKNAINNPPKEGETELGKWIRICVDELGKEASTTFARNKTSLLAKYCHALRTFIIAQLSSGESKDEFDNHINLLKSKLVEAKSAEEKSSK